MNVAFSETQIPIIIHLNTCLCKFSKNCVDKLLIEKHQQCWFSIHQPCCGYQVFQTDQTLKLSWSSTIILSFLFPWFICSKAGQWLWKKLFDCIKKQIGKQMLLQNFQETNLPAQVEATLMTLLEPPWSSSVRVGQYDRELPVFSSTHKNSNKWRVYALTKLTRECATGTDESVKLLQNWTPPETWTREALSSCILELVFFKDFEISHLILYNMRSW